MKRKGDRIVGDLDLLNRNKILSRLSQQAKQQLQALDIFPSIDSTNTQALAQIAQQKSGYVCLAEQQTAGRGRLQRSWVSPDGCNFYGSILWKFTAGAAQLEGLSLATAIAVARALEACGVSSIGLKWPNDVLWQDKKLAGILLEMSGDAAGPCYVVIGVGINIRMPRRAAQQIDQPWVDVETSINQPVDRNEVTAIVLSYLVEMLLQFQVRGFAAFKAEWEKRDVIRDRKVDVYQGNMSIQGIAKGVDATGGLLLHLGSGVRCFKGGEITVRKAT